MRSLAALVLLTISLPLAAQQAGSVTFDAPTTGGAPSGYRLYREGALVGPVTSGQVIQGLFPSNAGTWMFAVEAFNAAGAGPRVTRSVTLTPPLQPPGPVINIIIASPCTQAVPPCSLNVTVAP